MAELDQLREALQMLATSPAPGLTEEPPSGGGNVGSQDDSQQQRALVFRAQQSVLQGDKSEQELVGVADRIENIRMQLENNRIDSYDRQTRLRERVFVPLSDLLENEYNVLSSNLLETQAATLAGDALQPAKTAISTLEDVLIKLKSIRDSMLDIESFNEIVDLVRGLLDDQDDLIKETEETQKKRILEFLK